MNRVSGRRYDREPRKLNMKKVIATIMTIIVIIMVIISFKRILTKDRDNEISTLTTYISILEDNKWGVIDNKGNVIVEAYYDEMIIIPDKNEDVFLCTYDVDYNTETYKTKIINKDGNEILTNYENVQAIENSNTSTTWYEDAVLKFQENGKYGIINLDGKVLVEPEYDNIYSLPGVEETIIVEKDGKKGLLNTKTAEIIIEPEYIEIEGITENHEDGYIVKNNTNKYGVIANDKSKVLEEKYDEIKNIIGNNYYVVVENGITQIVDNKGNVVLNSGFDSVEKIKLDNFIITKSGKYGVIDKTGTTVVNPEYENVKFGGTDSFVAQKNGKYGIILKDGTIAVDFTYDKISYIEEADFFQAEKDLINTDIIDRNFNVVLSEVIVSELNTDEGYLRVRNGEEYEYYNFKFEKKTNKEVLSTNTLFLIKENGKYGYENKAGERIVDCIYDDAKEQNEFGYCVVKKDGLWGALKADGTIVVEPSRNLDEYLYIDFISEWNRYNDLKLNIYTK